MCSFWCWAGLWSRGSQIPSVSYWLMYHPYTSHSSCWNSYHQYLIIPISISHNIVGSVNSFCLNELQPLWNLPLNFSIGMWTLFWIKIMIHFQILLWKNVHFPHIDFIHWKGPLEENGYNVCWNFNLDLFVGEVFLSALKKKVFVFFRALFKKA